MVRGTLAVAKKGLLGVLQQFNNMQHEFTLMTLHARCLCLFRVCVCTV